MPIVRVKGVENPMKFPDDMDINDIRAFLQRRFSKEAISARQSMPDSRVEHRIYNPSLVEKAASGISDLLVDKDIISNRFGANEVGKSLTAIGEFLPGIGDASAGDEFGRAAAKGDGLNMGLAALGAIPLVGDAVKKVVKKLDPTDFKNEFINMKLYHGTNKDLDKFDLSLGGKVSKSEVGSTGVSLTQNKEIAEEFANLASKSKGTPTILNLVHRAEKPASIELDGMETNLEMASTISQAWDDGFDAIMLKNYKTPNGIKGNVIIVKDPNQIRKPSANFDPDKKFSPELLAGIGGLGFAFALSDDDEQERSYQ